MDDNKTESLAHSGVKGMKHGVRRYQNEDGSLTPEGRRHYGLNPKYANVSNADMQKELAYARNKSEYVGLMTANARKKSDDVKALTKSIVGLAKTGTSAASTVANQRKTDAESRINAANADINKQISDLKTTQAAQQKMIKGMMNDSSKTDERSKLEKEYLSNDEKLKSYNKQIEANNAEKGQYQDAVDRANYNKNMTDNAAKVADQTGAYDYAGKFASRKEYESERQQAMDNLEELDPDQLKSIIDRIKLEKEYENLLNPPKPSKMEQFKKAFDSIDHWLALGLTIMQIRSLMQKRNTSNASSASQDAFSDEEFLEHYGVKGQKWGVLRYTNEDGTLNAAGMKRYGYTEGDAKSATKALNRMEKDYAKAALAEEVSKQRHEIIADKYAYRAKKTTNQARRSKYETKRDNAQKDADESYRLIRDNDVAKERAANKVLNDKSLYFKGHNKQISEFVNKSAKVNNLLGGAVGAAILNVGQPIAAETYKKYKAMEIGKDSDKIQKYREKLNKDVQKYKEKGLWNKAFSSESAIDTLQGTKIDTPEKPFQYSTNRKMSSEVNKEQFEKTKNELVDQSKKIFSDYKKNLDHYAAKASFVNNPKTFRDALDNVWYYQNEDGDQGDSEALYVHEKGLEKEYSDYAKKYYEWNNDKDALGDNVARTDMWYPWDTHAISRQNYENINKRFESFNNKFPDVIKDSNSAWVALDDYSAKNPNDKILDTPLDEMTPEQVKKINDIIKQHMAHSEFLAHAGVKGMKKGVRRYQNADGSLTPEGYRHYGIDPNWQPQKQETPDEREKRIRKQIESDYRTKALKAKYETKAERTRSKEVERQMSRENKMEIQRMKQIQTAQNKINQQNMKAEAKIENQAKADNRKNIRKNVMKAVVGSAVVGMLVAKGVHNMRMERLVTMNAHEARMAKINGGGFINHVLNNRNSEKLAKINGRTQIKTAKAVGENGSVSFGTAAATKNAAKATSMTISGGNGNAKATSETAKPVSEPKPKNATSEKPKNEAKPKNAVNETKPVSETPNKTGVPGKEVGVRRVEPKRTFTEQREHDKRQKELEKTFYGSVVDQTGNFTSNNKTMLNDEDRKRLAELKEAQRRRNEEKGLIEKKTVENGESMISDIFKRLGGKK